MQMLFRSHFEHLHWLVEEMILPQEFVRIRLLIILLFVRALPEETVLQKK